MNDEIKELLEDADVNQSSTAVVLNTQKDNKQFELDVE